MAFLPSASRSSWMDLGMFQTGFARFSATVKVPSGLCQRRGSAGKVGSLGSPRATG
ncbi:hypothetical protein D3C86_2226900 [compost metagenome]